MKQIKIGVLGLALLLLAGTASAHVTVRPNEVGVGKFENFILGVPTEKDIPTVGVRLVVPEGLEHVSPVVVPGWRIALTRAEEEEAGHMGEGDEHHGRITEISWTGGSIPAGFKMDFAFSAKVPSSETTLPWKAYQTYSDGSVVAWELGPDQQQPKKADGSNDYSSSGPYSQTKVVDDLKPAAGTDSSKHKITAESRSVDALTLSMLAMVVSILCLYFVKRGR
jgi:uncharacterized protein YcnI